MLSLSFWLAFGVIFWFLKSAVDAGSLSLESVRVTKRTPREPMGETVDEPEALRRAA